MPSPPPPWRALLPRSEDGVPLLRAKVSGLRRLLRAHERALATTMPGRRTAAGRAEGGGSGPPSTSGRGDGGGGGGEPTAALVAAAGACPLLPTSQDPPRRPRTLAEMLLPQAWASGRSGSGGGARTTGDAVLVAAGLVSPPRPPAAEGEVIVVGDDGPLDEGDAADRPSQGGGGGQEVEDESSPADAGGGVCVSPAVEMAGGEEDDGDDAIYSADEDGEPLTLLGGRYRAAKASGALGLTQPGSQHTLAAAARPAASDGTTAVPPSAAEDGSRGPMEGEPSVGGRPGAARRRPPSATPDCRAPLTPPAGVELRFAAPVTALALSPSGRVLALTTAPAGLDAPARLVEVWRLPEGGGNGGGDHPRRLACLAARASAPGSEAHAFAVDDRCTGPPILWAASAGLALAAAPVADGGLAAVVLGGRPGRPPPFVALPPPRERAAAALVTLLPPASGDSLCVAAGGTGGAVALYELHLAGGTTPTPAGPPAPLPGCDGAALASLSSGEGGLLVGTTATGRVILWDVAVRALVASGDGGGATAAHWAAPAGGGGGGLLLLRRPTSMAAAALTVDGLASSPWTGVPPSAACAASPAGRPPVVAAVVEGQGRQPPALRAWDGRTGAPLLSAVLPPCGPGGACVAVGGNCVAAGLGGRGGGGLVVAVGV